VGQYGQAISFITSAEIAHVAAHHFYSRAVAHLKLNVHENQFIVAFYLYEAICPTYFGGCEFAINKFKKRKIGSLQDCPQSFFRECLQGIFMGTISYLLCGNE